MPRHLPPAPDTNPPRSPHSPRSQRTSLPSPPLPPPFPFSSPPPPGSPAPSKALLPLWSLPRSRFEFDLPAGDPYKDLLVTSAAAA
ncbi:hypothetical protein GQ55_9G596800 [Panicum hallii var. hallii]|uniref:Uncharacterized protein n=1 Tax=Panicum hallii var. hallii TaxID=1504633 RepID=A0A2T7CH48_9POAL|nr:hypothetical protein GQ55_9G596800 [Panicum hallii var. hallii]